MVINGYSGTAGDLMSHVNGDQFTTRDSDHDSRDHNCAVAYQGAWWFKACHNGHLNGVYQETPTAVYGMGIQAAAYKGFNYSLKGATMSIL